jgi:hypothetical protein
MSLFPLLAGPSQEMWRAVTLDLGIPYTFIHYARQYEKVWVSQCSVFWRQEDVLTLCHDAETDISCQILDIWLLLPCQTDSRGSWRWVAVTEVLAGAIKHSPSPWPYYFTSEDELIQGGGDNIAESKEKLKKSLLRIWMHRETHADDKNP